MSLGPLCVNNCKLDVSSFRTCWKGCNSGGDIDLGLLCKERCKGPYHEVLGLCFRNGGYSIFYPGCAGTPNCPVRSNTCPSTHPVGPDAFGSCCKSGFHSPNITGKCPPLKNIPIEVKMKDRQVKCPAGYYALKGGPLGPTDPIYFACCPNGYIANQQ